MTKALAPENKLPALYQPEAVEEIISRLSAGETLTAICNDEHLPATCTVHAWRIRHEEFATLYADARLSQAHTLFDMSVDVARALVSDDEAADKLGYLGITHQRANVAINAFQTAAARIAPKEYAANQKGGGIIAVQINTNLGDGKTPEGGDNAKYVVTIDQRKSDDE